ncbi:MAG: lysophospholipid acyltransferase family protein [Actinomycetota bacterium]
MAELVYPPVIRLLKLWFRATGMRITITGAEHIPRAGGAVLAANHVSYADFIFVGLAADRMKRRTRFMAKQSVFEHRVSGPLMRGMRHIPVDRSAGMGSFRQALSMLKAGEVVGLFPEATTSRSFTVKELKPGAVRMAQSTGVPVIPVAVWGSQRILPKGHPRSLWSRGRHVLIAVGEPILADRSARPADLNTELRKILQELLTDLQNRTPEQPGGEANPWWHPAHLGGTAPTPKQAAALDARDSTTEPDSL